MPLTPLYTPLTANVRENVIDRHLTHVFLHWPIQFLASWHSINVFSTHWCTDYPYAPHSLPLYQKMWLTDTLLIYFSIGPCPFWLLSSASMQSPQTALYSHTYLMVTTALMYFYSGCHYIYTVDLNHAQHWPPLQLKPSLTASSPDHFSDALIYWLHRDTSSQIQYLFLR